MNSPSEPRRNRAGFTLLETLLSLGLAGAVLILVYAGFSRALDLPERVRGAYYRTELARSLIEEAIVTYPDVEREGQIEDQWTWSIHVEEHPPIEPTRFDRDFQLLTIEAAVADTARPAQVTRLSVTVFRRRPG